MQIGLLGFGTVGRGVYDIVKQRQDIHIARVLCLEDIRLPDAAVTRDFQEILDDPAIDTVVEAMGGLHPAYEFVRSAMEAGKHIVTSNKALVAAYYDELIPLAERLGVKFRCTAAVGGGIGWLSEVERSRRIQAITQVGGIMNGTCNYILDSMTRLHLDYADALGQAQALGYAEANPATDVEGIDTWHKVILSANIAFGISLDKSTVPAAGIQNIRREDVAAFADHGLVCRLISTGKRTAEGFSAYVQPTLMPAGSLEAAVPLNFNLITLVGATSDRMSFYGQGAGRYPTAYYEVQDCVDEMGCRCFYTPYGRRAAAVNREEMTYYVRCPANAWPEEKTGERWGSGIITSPIPVEEIHAWLGQHPEAFIAAIG